MENNQRPIPIYTTNGDPAAFLVYPYIFSRDGDWIGFTNAAQDVYSVLGAYVGRLTKDPRILCKRVEDNPRPPQPVPPRPNRIYPPSPIPLAPLMSELSYDTLDVLMEAPDLLHPLDSGEFRPDLD